MIIKGTCHCGQAVIETEIESVKGIIQCLCRDCQRHLGNFAPWVVCNSTKTVISGTIGEYASSDIADRLFCATCGSTLAKRPKAGEIILFTAGIFPQPLEFVVLKQVFSEDIQPWMNP